jgi:hypothetical protein
MNTALHNEAELLKTIRQARHNDKVYGLTFAAECVELHIGGCGPCNRDDLVAELTIQANPKHTDAAIAYLLLSGTIEAVEDGYYDMKA